MLTQSLMAFMNVVISYSASWQGWTIETRGYPMTLVLDGVAGTVCITCLPFLAQRAKATS